jgi:hypothetical protein
MKFFFYGDILKNYKAFAVIIILIFTFISLLYLFYIAKQIDKYTFSNNAIGSLIIYSSSGGDTIDKKTMSDVLEGVDSVLELSGYEVINLGCKKGFSRDDIRKSITNKMKKAKKYYVIDVGASLAVNDKNTILIRLDKESPIYSKNEAAAISIKKDFYETDIKAAIYNETNKKYNQDIGYISLKFEVSNKNTYIEVKNILISAVFALTK